MASASEENIRHILIGRWPELEFAKRSAVGHLACKLAELAFGAVRLDDRGALVRVQEFNVDLVSEPVVERLSELLPLIEQVVDAYIAEVVKDSGVAESNGPSARD